MTLEYVSRTAVAAFCAIAVLAGTTTGAEAASGDTASRGAVSAKPGIRYAADPARAVPGSYIVVLKDSAVPRSGVDTTARRLTATLGGTVGHTYSAALRGFEARLSASAAARLATDSHVAYVEQNQQVTIFDTQLTPPSWGLDRVDQRALPLDTTYTYSHDAKNVHAYIVDTGIAFGHHEFGGRAVSGFDAVDGGPADDCNGHGTHVAGTVGGETFGIAKKVTLVAVRVLDCQGSGTFDGVIAGIDWVTANAVKPAVANMSLGGGVNASVDSAVQASIASGITYAVAAGNSSADACNSSPARVPEALTVAASAADDSSPIFTNRGPCVDLYAPGVQVVSAWNTDDTATRTLDGTSMASPHVAGVAALYLAGHPDWSPAQVHEAIVDAATPGVITNAPPATANKLLFSAEVQPPTDDFAVTVTPRTATLAPGGTLTATLATTLTRGASLPLTVQVGGLPDGATAVVDPSPVASGQNAVLTVHLADGTRSGLYPLTVTAIGGQTAHRSTLTLTVPGAPGCAGTDSTPVSIPDAGPAVFGTIVISGCTRTISSTATVAVDIQHTWRGDLIIDLVAPSGALYRLKDADSDSSDNVHETYTVDLSRESPEGAWRLKVQDVATGDTGSVTTWSLNL